MPVGGWSLVLRYLPPARSRRHPWNELREKSLHNRVFDSLDALENHLEAALRELEQDRELVDSIVAWPWIVNAL